MMPWRPKKTRVRRTRVVQDRGPRGAASCGKRQVFGLRFTDKGDLGVTWFGVMTVVQNGDGGETGGDNQTGGWNDARTEE